MTKNKFQPYSNPFTTKVDELKEDFMDGGGKLDEGIIDRALQLRQMFFSQDGFNQCTTKDSFDDVEVILKDQGDKL